MGMTLETEAVTDLRARLKGRVIIPGTTRRGRSSWVGSTAGRAR